MADKEILGAKASNAGDDFHVLWALHHALRLLRPDSELTAVTVEGMSAEDSEGTPTGAFEGVDVALYFGGDSLSRATHVELAQLKYSTASPDSSWTVARLTSSTKRTGNNSVIARLAKAYSIARQKAPGNEVSIKVKLVSNQPIHSEVVATISMGLAHRGKGLEPQQKDHWLSLRSASGLKATEFIQFVGCLDFDECQGPSRFAVHQRVIEKIAEVCPIAAGHAAMALREVVYRRMLPDEKLGPITKATLLSAMYVGDPAALMPCPPDLKEVDSLVPRSATARVIDLFSAGHQRACLHGAGGCGKTTILQELRDLLPQESELLIFDCYGGGRYLDSDGHRHLPELAFLQLSNELSVRVGAPMLIAANSSVQYVREFSSRLKRAAEIVAARNQEALLVVALDAADNSITAASRRVPAERSFVHDFAALGDLPSNVRLLISTRSSRRASLELPSTFKLVEVFDFLPEETEQFVRLRLPGGATDVWVEDLQYLSSGNPRVISYAFHFGGNRPNLVLDYLRPNGKNLRGIFAEGIREALRKNGDPIEFQRLCAALMVLARPIPVAHLAGLLSLPINRVTELSGDLRPGLRDEGEGLGFADEDFEAFISEEGKDDLETVQRQAADYLLGIHTKDAYAAEHVAAALFDAGSGAKLLELVEEQSEPNAILDPLKRRAVQAHRLKLAMQVCRQAGRTPESILILLRGADALKTDAALQSMLLENVDLAVRSTPDSLRKTVLSDAGNVRLHGSVLCQLMLERAIAGDKVRARDWGRQFRAWLALRKNSDYDRRSKGEWKLDGSDVAAEGEALIRIGDVADAIDVLRGWSPRTLMPPVVVGITRHLVCSGSSDLALQCLSAIKGSPAWDILIRIPLAMAGHEVDVRAIENGICRWVRRGWVDTANLRNLYRNRTQASQTLEWLLVGAELVAARTREVDGVRSFLELLVRPELRRRDNLFAGEHDWIDASLRAYALLERFEGREATVEGYLLPPSQPPSEEGKKGDKLRDDEAKRRGEELENLIRRLLPIYSGRAEILLGETRVPGLPSLTSPLSHLSATSYGIGDRFDFNSMCDRVGLSLATMLHVPGIDIPRLAAAAMDAASIGCQGHTSRELELLTLLCYNEQAHEAVIQIAVQQVESIAVQQAPARERAEQLVALARLLMDVSPDDSTAAFSMACTALEGVDIESSHSIGMLEGLTRRAAQFTSPQERRRIAREISLLTDYLQSYLGSHDFPWSSAVRAIAHLDSGTSLSAVASWQDRGQLSLDEALPPVITSGLSNSESDDDVALAMMALLQDISGSLWETIGGRLMASSKPAERRLEEFARHAMMRLDASSKLRELADFLQKSNSHPGGPWLTQCRKVFDFLASAQPASISSSEAGRVKASPTPDWIRDELSALGGALTTRAEIEHAVAQILQQARDRKEYIGIEPILLQIQQRISRPRWRAHLAALCECEFPSVYSSDHGDAIANCIKNWRTNSLAIEEWCKQDLPQILSERMPLFHQSGSWVSTLEKVLDAADLPDGVVADAILEGIERNAKQWTSRDVYEVLEILSSYLSHADAASTLAGYIKQANKLSQDCSRFGDSGVEADTVGAVGRFLYALLGDVDLRVRWQAAHALRTVARLGRQDILDATFAQWNRLSEPDFRDSAAPFYWLSSRLWLLITAARIAGEMPEMLASHGKLLYSIAVDEDFPHLLSCHFAKVATLALVDAGELRLTADEDVRVRGVNVPRRLAQTSEPKVKVRHGSRRSAGNEERRFHFDSTDTLPYWYSTPMGFFPDVSRDEFLSVAERWILDKWHGSNDVWKWDSEPRKVRLAREPYGTSHRHGSLPTMERAHTHLEWHAMWCVVGELLKTRPMAIGVDGEWGGWAYWYSSSGLSEPPLWLSDLRQTKPLESSLWFPSGLPLESWLEAVSAESMLDELGIRSFPEELIVAGHAEIAEGDLRESIHISSALVSPATASALLRALQTVDNPWDYKIPDEDDTLTMDAEPYQLVGWLRHPEQDARLDVGDGVRRESRSHSVAPGANVLDVLRLSLDQRTMQCWRGEDGLRAFRYIQWSDDMSDTAMRSGDDVLRSYGNRLFATRQALSAYLASRQMDLIVEIDVTRRTKDSYEHVDSEEPQEARYDLVVVLRRDGAIETAEGIVGSWAIPGARATTGRRSRHTEQVDGSPSGGAARKSRIK
ncbi:hypothetical protein [Cupriavidus necator]